MNKKYEKITDVSRNYDYTTRNLLEFRCQQNFYKVNGKDCMKGNKCDYFSTN